MNTPHFLYRALLMFTTLSAFILSVVAVATCEFMKVKDGDYFGLWNHGKTDNDNSYYYYSDGCTTDFSHNPIYDGLDLEDSSTLAARAFGTIAAIVGGLIFLGSFVALFAYPRWLWLVLVVTAVSGHYLRGFTNCVAFLHVSFGMLVINTIGVFYSFIIGLCSLQTLCFSHWYSWFTMELFALKNLATIIILVTALIIHLTTTTKIVTRQTGLIFLMAMIIALMLER